MMPRKWISPAVLRVRQAQQHADDEAAYSDRTLYLLGEGAAQKIPDSPMTPTTRLAGSEHSRIDGERSPVAPGCTGPANAEAVAKNEGITRQEAERLGNQVPINNPHMVAARRKKAEALITVLQQHKITAEMAGRMEDHQWAMVAKKANVNPPGGPETKAMVIDALGRAEAQQRRSA